MSETDDDIRQELLPLFKDMIQPMLLELNRTLMLLEQPDVPDSVRSESTETILRIVHTIKGDSASLGLNIIEELSHDLESSLKSFARESGIEGDKEAFETWFATLDLIGEIATSEDSQEPVENNITDVKKKLRKNSLPEAVPKKQSAKKKTKATKKKKESQQIRPEEKKQENVEPREEVVRVSMKRLAKLSEVMSELMAMRLLQEQQILDLGGRVKNILSNYKESGKTRQEFSSLLDRIFNEGGINKENYRELSAAFKAEENWVQDMAKSNGALLSNLQMSLKDVRQLGTFMRSQEEELRTLQMTPASDLFSSFHRWVRDTSQELGKSVVFNSSGESVQLDRAIIQQLREPLIHLLRNALDHGIEDKAERAKLGKPEKARLALRAFTGGSGVVIEIEDDGRGMNTEKIRQAALHRGMISETDAETMTDRAVQSLVFQSGFSTKKEVSKISGRGVGLDAVQVWVNQLRGRLDWETTPGQGTLVRLHLPLTMATIQALIAKVGRHKFAIPISAVDRVLQVGKKQITTVEARASIIHEGQPIELMPLAQLLGIQIRTNMDKAEIPVILSWGTSGPKGWIVDDLLGEQEIVMKHFTRYFKKVPNVSGAAILGTGEVVLVLNTSDLHYQSASTTGQIFFKQEETQSDVQKKIRVLAADDSQITRTMEKNILTKAGYQVTEAHDGIDALEKLENNDFDLVVTDVQMPRMGGIGLTKKIRASTLLRDIPVIIVSFKDTEEDKLRGLKAGANAYLGKGQFSQAKLLDLAKQLTGG